MRIKLRAVKPQKEYSFLLRNGRTERVYSTSLTAAIKNLYNNFNIKETDVETIFLIEDEEI